MRNSSGLTAAVLAAVLIVPTVRAGDGEHPDLSGVWRFDPSQSEDLRTKVRELRGDRPRGGGGRRGGGFAGGRGGPGSPGSPGGDGGAGMRELLDAPAALTVTQTATEITLVEEDGRLRALHPDGRPYKDSSGREVKTRWSEAGELVAETKGGRGRVVETFTVAANPTRLLVTLLVELRGRPLVVRRVYVRPPAAPAPPPAGELPPPSPPSSDLK